MELEDGRPQSPVGDTRELANGGSLSPGMTGAVALMKDVSALDLKTSPGLLEDDESATGMFSFRSRGSAESGTRRDAIMTDLTDPQPPPSTPEADGDDGGAPENNPALISRVLESAFANPAGDSALATEVMGQAFQEALDGAVDATADEEASGYDDDFEKDAPLSHRSEDPAPAVDGLDISSFNGCFKAPETNPESSHEEDLSQKESFPDEESAAPAEHNIHSDDEAEPTRHQNDPDGAVAEGDDADGEMESGDRPEGEALGVAAEEGEEGASVEMTVPKLEKEMAEGLVEEGFEDAAPAGDHEVAPAEVAPAEVAIAVQETTVETANPGPQPCTESEMVESHDGAGDTLPVEAGVDALHSQEDMSTAEATADEDGAQTVPRTIDEAPCDDRPDGDSPRETSENESAGEDAAGDETVPPESSLSQIEEPRPEAVESDMTEVGAGEDEVPQTHGNSGEDQESPEAPEEKTDAALMEFAAKLESASPGADGESSIDLALKAMDARMEQLEQFDTLSRKNKGDKPLAATKPAGFTRRQHKAAAEATQTHKKSSIPPKEPVRADGKSEQRKERLSGGPASKGARKPGVLQETKKSAKENTLPVLANDENQPRLEKEKEGVRLPSLKPRAADKGEQAKSQDKDAAAAKKRTVSAQEVKDLMEKIRRPRAKPVTPPKRKLAPAKRIAPIAETGSSQSIGEEIEEADRPPLSPLMRRVALPVEDEELPPVETCRQEQEIEDDVSETFCTMEVMLMAGEGHRAVGTVEVPQECCLSVARMEISKKLAARFGDKYKSFQFVYRGFPVMHTQESDIKSTDIGPTLYVKGRESKAAKDKSVSRKVPGSKVPKGEAVRKMGMRMAHPDAADKASHLTDDKKRSKSVSSSKRALDQSGHRRGKTSPSRPLSPRKRGSRSPSPNDTHYHYAVAEEEVLAAPRRAGAKAKDAGLEDDPRVARLKRQLESRFEKKFEKRVAELEQMYRTKLADLEACSKSAALASTGEYVDRDGPFPITADIGKTKDGRERKEVVGFISIKAKTTIWDESILPNGVKPSSIVASVAGGIRNAIREDGGDGVSFGTEAPMKKQMRALLNKIKGGEIDKSFAQHYENAGVYSVRDCAPQTLSAPPTAASTPLTTVKGILHETNQLRAETSPTGFPKTFSPEAAETRVPFSSLNNKENSAVVAHHTKSKREKNTQRSLELAAESLEKKLIQHNLSPGPDSRILM